MNEDRAPLPLNEAALPSHVRTLLDEWDQFMAGRVGALVERMEAWPEAAEQIRQRWIDEIEDDPEAIRLLSLLFPRYLSKSA